MQEKKKKRPYTPDDAKDRAAYLFEHGYYSGDLSEDDLARKIFEAEKIREKEVGVELPKVLIPKF